MNRSANRGRYGRNGDERLIGVISDTHGLVRPEALDALHGVELVLHAGDVGNSQVLEALKGIAPSSQFAGTTTKANGQKSCLIGK